MKLTKELFLTGDVDTKHKYNWLLSGITNYMGINLCSILGIEETKLEDKQLTEIKIIFMPTDEKLKVKKYTKEQWVEYLFKKVQDEKKYQEALDEIKSCINIIIANGENYKLVKNQVPQECFDTLQDLINNWEHLNIIAVDTEKELNEYKRALDKACEKLSELTKSANIPELGVHSVVYSKEAWKEWLVNE